MARRMGAVKKTRVFSFSVVAVQSFLTLVTRWQYVNKEFLIICWPKDLGKMLCKSPTSESTRKSKTSMYFNSFASICKSRKVTVSLWHFDNADDVLWSYLPPFKEFSVVLFFFLKQGLQTVVVPTVVQTGLGLTCRGGLSWTPGLPAYSCSHSASAGTTGYSPLLNKANHLIKTGIWKKSMYQ